MNQIYISKLLIRQFVIIYPLNDDIKHNLDYLSLKFLQPSLKQFKQIALGFADFNYYLNNAKEPIEYESLAFAFVNENLQIKFKLSYETCYANKTLKENLVYCLSIVHLTFFSLRKIRFTSVLFNNNLFVEKNEVKMLTFSPANYFKEVVNHYFSNPEVEKFELFQSPAFLQLYDKSDLLFRIDRRLQLFKADCYLERLSGFTHFEIEKKIKI